MVRSKSSIEQHTQTIIAVVIAALIGWAGITLQELQKTISAMSAQITTLQAEVTTLRNLNQDRYTATQAARDWELYRQEVAEIRARLRALELGK